MISAPRDMWGINCFQIMVDQLSEPRALHILGITKPVLRRYLSGSLKVPRMAVLALFWETPYGRGMIDSDHNFEVQLLHRRIQHLEKKNARIRALLMDMMRTTDFGCANDPIAL